MDSLTSTLRMRGFSTLEVLIAMAIMTTTLTAVVMVCSGTQTLLPDGELDQGAQQKAAALFAHETALVRQDFKLLGPFSTTTDDGYREAVTVDLWDGDPYAVARVSMRIDWSSALHIPQSLTETTLVGNDDATDGGDTCEPWLSGDWSHPRITSYKLADLLAATSSLTVSDIDVYRGKIYVGISKTATKSMPTLLVFDEGSPLHYLGGVDNNPLAQTGLASIFVTNRYVYAANESSFTKGQLQVFDASTSVPSLIKTYKIDLAQVPTEGLGSTIIYKKGVVYLGLTAVGNGGTEFNVIDVHDPLHPSRTSGAVIGRTVSGIVVKGSSTVYLATDDTTREAQVVGGASFNAPGMQNWGYGNGIYAVGNTLYLGRSFANGADELYVLDATHPNVSLVPLGSFKTSSSINDLVVRDHSVFLVASTSPQFRIIDASHPTAMTSVATLNLPGAGVTLDCELNTLYAGSNDDSGNGYLSTITPS